MQQLYEQLSRIEGLALAQNEPMSRHTTFRTGGPAELYAVPDRRQLAEVLACAGACDVPVTLIGNGSNLLVGDGGVRGLVVEIGKGMAAVRIDGVFLTAEAGALLSRAAKAAAEAGLSGLEFAAGIPGSVGGAVVMNAGAYGGEMKDVLTAVTVLTPEGEERKLPAEELCLSYRYSNIAERGYTVLAARFRLAPAKEPQEIRNRMEELRERRISKQPLEFPSAGSTFKRPEGYFAGKLIEDAGLRGFRVGDAQVSEKHCGFIINRGAATSTEIRSLIRKVQERVSERFGVRLEPEVHMIGEFGKE